MRRLTLVVLIPVLATHHGPVAAAQSPSGAPPRAAFDVATEN